MDNQNGDKQIDKDTYKTISHNLQNITMIFFGFIIFVAYILIPYYSQADEYQNNRNILFYVDRMYDDFSFIKAIVSNYMAQNDTIKKYQEDIDKRPSAYFNNYSDLTNIYKIHTNNSLPREEQFKRIAENATSYNLTIYRVCDKEPDFSKWFRCNTHEDISSVAKSILIVVNSTTTKQIDDKINNTDSLIKNVEYYNNKTSLVNMTSIKSWNKIVSDWKKFRATSISAELDLASLNNYKDEGYFFPNFKKNEANLTTKIESRIKEYVNKIDTLEYPIIGRVPVLSLNLTFLSFPIIIAIGFSFLSFQFKKLIKLNKKLKLNRDNDEDKFFISWIDPLQSFPERIYPILIMFAPLVVFVILLVLITFTWYLDEPYMVTSLSHDVLFIQKFYKDVFLGLNFFGILIFSLSYLQIFRAWRST